MSNKNPIYDHISDALNVGDDATITMHDLKRVTASMISNDAILEMALKLPKINSYTSVTRAMVICEMGGAYGSTKLTGSGRDRGCYVGTAGDFASSLEKAGFLIAAANHITSEK